VLTIPHHKKWRYENVGWVYGLIPWVQSEHWKRDMRFGSWDVISLCRSGMTLARELTRYKLELVSVQFRWDKDDTVRAKKKR
jgi:hypothetical protein